MAGTLTVEKVLENVPPFEGKEEIVEKYHRSNHIVKEVLDAHVAFSSDYDELIDNVDFKKTIPVEDQLFDFCKKNLNYVIEKGIYQSSRSPAGIVELGAVADYGVDCKHFAGFIAGCLDAMNRKVGKKEFNWFYRFASYDNNPEPGHVFVVTKDVDGEELWIDPVLSSIDKRYPKPRYFFDKTVDMPLVRLSGVNERKNLPIQYYQRPKKLGCAGGCKGNCMGHCGKRKGIGDALSVAAVQSKSTGATKIESAGSALEAVGGVVTETGIGALAGAIIVAAGALTTLIGKVFGSNWHEDTEVRWLLQNFQYFVLSQGGVTSDNKVNEALLQQAYNWFYAVLGIPLYDVGTLHIIAGLGGDGRSQRGVYTIAERAARYLAYPEITKLAAGVTLEQAQLAAQIAEQFFYYTDAAQTVPAKPGAWATFPVSTYWTTLWNSYATGSASPSSNVPSIINPAPAGSGVWGWVQANPIVSALLGLTAGGLLYEALTYKKRKKQRA